MKQVAPDRQVWAHFPSPGGTPVVSLAVCDSAACDPAAAGTDPTSVIAAGPDGEEPPVSGQGPAASVGDSRRPIGSLMGLQISPQTKRLQPMPSSSPSPEGDRPKSDSFKGDGPEGDSPKSDGPESDSGPESDGKSYGSGAHGSGIYGPVTYDSVTVHYRADGEEPMTVSRVHRLADSFFPSSGERALQIIDDPRKGPPRGLFDVDLILIPPEEISHLVLRKEGKERTVTPEEALGADPPPGFSDSEGS